MSSKRVLWLLLVCALLSASAAHAAVLSDGASTQHLADGTATTKPSGTTATWMAWFYLESDVNRAAVLMNYINAGVAQITLVTDTDGTTLLAFVFDGTASDQPAVISMLVGRWYFLAVSKTDASTVKVYTGTESASVTLATTVTRTLADFSNSWTNVLTGTATANASANVRVERFKLYSGVKTLEEIEAERVSLAPSSTTNLFSYNPLLADDDYAGTQGSNPILFVEQGGTGFTTVAGPVLALADANARSFSLPAGEYIHDRGTGTQYLAADEHYMNEMAVLTAAISSRRLLLGVGR